MKIKINKESIKIGDILILENISKNKISSTNNLTTKVKFRIFHIDNEALFAYEIWNKSNKIFFKFNEIEDNIYNMKPNVVQPLGMTIKLNIIKNKNIIYNLKSIFKSK